jgi:hypothetical protein
MKLERGLIIRGERRMTGGKTLSGKIWLELDGKGRIELTPQDAFELAKGIFRNIGIELEFEYDRFRQ